MKDIRFRQYKIMIWDAEKVKQGWLVLNRLVKYAIKDWETLERALEYAHSKYAVLRVFQTASLFSNPVDLRGNQSTNNRLLKSYMVLESDKDINYNIRMAQYLYGELSDRGVEPQILYTGGKSIHLIFEFHYTRFLGTQHMKLLSGKPLSFDKRIWLEKMARFNFLQRVLPEQLPPYGFDYTTALDAFRVVPVFGEINLSSHRKSILLEPSDLLATREWILAKSVV